MRLVTSLALLAAAAAAPALAQGRQVQTFGPAAWQLSPEYKTVQRSQLDTQKRLLLSFADSMPEHLYRDKVTPVQRDFAQQLHHVVVANLNITRFYGGLPADAQAPPRADTAAVFNTRAGMRAYIISAFDWLTWALDQQTPENRHIVVEFIGGGRIPRWQVWDELNQHTLWTLGQVVANFRKNNMAPPPFQFF